MQMQRRDGNSQGGDQRVWDIHRKKTRYPGIIELFPGQIRRFIKRWWMDSEITEQVFLQAFYSIQNTSIPVAINITVLLSNILFSFILIKIMGANGLGLAYSLAGCTSVTLLVIMLRTKVGNIRGKEILNSVVRIAAACVIMYICIFLVRALLESMLPMERKLAQLVELVLLIGVGGLTYLIAAYILRIRELKSAMSLVLRKFSKRIKVAAVTEEEDGDEEEED